MKREPLLRRVSSARSSPETTSGVVSVLVTGQPKITGVDQLGHAKSQTWTNNNDLNSLTNALSQSTTFGYDRLNITVRHGYHMIFFGSGQQCWVPVWRQP